MTAIDIRNLRKSYGAHTAVDDLSVAIEDGEVFALLGPNGAGKTTTVEIRTGHRRRDHGQVDVLGQDPEHADLSWRVEIGVVLQEVRDAGQLTVAEIVRHYARYYPSPYQPDDVIARVGLTESAGVRLLGLSGGQRRRLDVALGIVGRPRLLFLDEPTTGFDPEARRQFWEIIRTLRGGTTILLTTHYLDEAEALADRVGVINAGRLVSVGSPAELGGRANAPAEVRWLDGSTHRAVTTSDPAGAVVELSRRFGGPVPGLTVARPSLEDIYLDLIGGVPS
ncbi:MAG TPA: ABC transporter ATP-binding protein [Actinomycetes bacterium]|jgi:ABC-2 type transport system ATP-binding protein|nr:ABC transporter ATP-binding protein [Actinomycetes bacterium]